MKNWTGLLPKLSQSTETPTSTLKNAISKCINNILGWSSSKKAQNTLKEDNIQTENFYSSICKKYTLHIVDNTIKEIFDGSKDKKPWENGNMITDEDLQLKIKGEYLLKKTHLLDKKTSEADKRFKIGKNTYTITIRDGKCRVGGLSKTGEALSAQEIGKNKFSILGYYHTNQTEIKIQQFYSQFISLSQNYFHIPENFHIPGSMTSNEDEIEQTFTEIFKNLHKYRSSLQTYNKMKDRFIGMHKNSDQKELKQYQKMLEMHKNRISKYKNNTCNHAKNIGISIESIHVLNEDDHILLHEVGECYNNIRDISKGSFNIGSFQLSDDSDIVQTKEKLEGVKKMITKYKDIKEGYDKHITSNLYVILSLKNSKDSRFTDLGRQFDLWKKEGQKYVKKMQFYREEIKNNLESLGISAKRCKEITHSRKDKAIKKILKRYIENQGKSAQLKQLNTASHGLFIFSQSDNPYTGEKEDFKPLYKNLLMYITDYYVNYYKNEVNKKSAASNHNTIITKPQNTDIRISEMKKYDLINIWFAAKYLGLEVKVM